MAESDKDYFYYKIMLKHHGYEPSKIDGLNIAETIDYFKKLKERDGSISYGFEHVKETEYAPASSWY